MESQLYIGDYMSSTVYVIVGIFSVFQCHGLGVSEQERGLQIMQRTYFTFIETQRSSYFCISLPSLTAKLLSTVVPDVISASSAAVHSFTHSNRPFVLPE